MRKEYKNMFLIRFVILLWAASLFTGCVTTPSPLPSGGLALPYEGIVSTSDRAFTVVNTGTGAGIAGATFGEDKAGIMGRANNSGDVSNYGGFFVAKGEKGIAVHGEALNEDGSNYGGHFITNGLKGTGVLGMASLTGNERNYGGYFEARGQKGIGAYAEAWGRHGVGVYGFARNMEHTINYGGHFKAWGGAGRGVRGEASGDMGFGVVGFAAGRGGRGVVGEASNSGEVTNYGGHFVAKGRYGRGIYARGGPDGYAAEFNGKIITKVLEIRGGSDISEQFEIRGTKEDSLPAPGMVVSIDSENPGDLVVSNKSYDRRVAGIISGAGGVNPGVLMGQQGLAADGINPVALTGRVYAWADASKVPIESGDLLTTSDTPGHAMKVTDYTRAQGAILGKAMSSLDRGKGLVLVLVTLQ